jgi:hypothetical protein
MKFPPPRARPWGLTKCKPCSSKGLKIIRLDRSGIPTRTLPLLHHDDTHPMYSPRSNNDIETRLQYHEHNHRRVRSRLAVLTTDIRPQCPPLLPPTETNRMAGKLLLLQWRRGITLAMLRNDPQATQDRPSQAKYSGHESELCRIRSY